MSTTLAGNNVPTETQTIDAVAINSKVGNALVGQPFSSNPGYSATWQGCGSTNLNINCGGITAASNVMISISEYGNVNDPVNSRFVGGAKFAVNNVSPRNGGVTVNIDIDSSTPLLIYVSILIS